MRVVVFIKPGFSRGYTLRRFGLFTGLRLISITSVSKTRFRR